MKKNQIISTIGAAIGIAFASVTVAHYELRSPSPKGTGYVYTINGVSQPIVLTGDGAPCQYASFCDSGYPCVYTNPYCEDAGAFEITDIRPNLTSSVGSPANDIRILTSIPVTFPSISFGGIAGAISGPSTTGVCNGQPIGQCWTATAPACNLSPLNCTAADGIGSPVTVSMTANAGHSATSAGTPLQDFWYACNSFQGYWTSTIALDGSGNILTNGASISNIPDHSGNGLNMLSEPTAPIWTSTGGGTGAWPYINFINVDSNGLENTSFPLPPGNVAYFFGALNGSGTQSGNGYFLYNATGLTSNSMVLLWTGSVFEQFTTLGPSCSLSVSSDSDFGFYTAFDGASSSTFADGLSTTCTAGTTPSNIPGLLWGALPGNTPFVGRAYYLLAYSNTSPPNSTCQNNIISYNNAQGFVN